MNSRFWSSSLLETQPFTSLQILLTSPYVMHRQQVNTNIWFKLHLSKRLMCLHEGWWLAKCTHRENSPAAFQHHLLLYWQIVPERRDMLPWRIFCFYLHLCRAAPCLDWGTTALPVTLQRGAARKSHHTHPPPEFCQATPEEPNPLLGKRASRRKSWCYHQKCLG